jgi:NAD(P) transhydrogenase subunit alpha
MRVAVPRETAAGERRVALVPDAVTRLAAAGFEVVVERGAGTQFDPDLAGVYLETGSAAENEHVPAAVADV